MMDDGSGAPAVGIADVTFISTRSIHPPIPRTKSTGWVGLGGGCLDLLPAGWVEEEKTITLHSTWGDVRPPWEEEEAVTKLFWGIILLLLLLLGWGEGWRGEGLVSRWAEWYRSIAAGVRRFSRVPPKVRRAVASVDGNDVCVLRVCSFACSGCDVGRQEAAVGPENESRGLVCCIFVNYAFGDRRCDAGVRVAPSIHTVTHQGGFRMAGCGRGVGGSGW